MCFIFPFPLLLPILASHKGNIRLWAVQWRSVRTSKASSAWFVKSKNRQIKMYQSTPISLLSTQTALSWSSSPVNLYVHPTFTLQPSSDWSWVSREASGFILVFCTRALLIKLWPLTAKWGETTVQGKLPLAQFSLFWHPNCGAYTMTTFKITPNFPLKLWWACPTPSSSAQHYSYAVTSTSCHYISFPTVSIP